MEEDEAAAEAARRWAAAMVKSRSGGVRPGGPERGTDKVALVCRDEERRFFFFKKKGMLARSRVETKPSNGLLPFSRVPPLGSGFF